MAAAPALRLQDVVYSWPGGRGFSIRIDRLEAPAGARLLLTGESGAGKTTLLNVISGVAAPDRGVVEIDGDAISTLSPARRDRFRAERLGVMFQMFNLLPYASPLENVLLQLAFAPERRRRVGDGARAEGRRLLAALGLPDDAIEGAQASNLSVGQQQRVAAARALIGGPSLVIADEPTSALDSATQDAFLDLLFEQLDATGASLLMVSHDRTLGRRFDQVVDLSEIARGRA